MTTIRFRSWNKGTQSWLAFYVHKRLPRSMGNQVCQHLFDIVHCPRTRDSFMSSLRGVFSFLLPASNKQQMKKIIVMCTSALWHGLYPGWRVTPLYKGCVTHSRISPTFCQAITALFFSHLSGARPRRSCLSLLPQFPRFLLFVRFFVLHFL